MSADTQLGGMTPMRVWFARQGALPVGLAIAALAGLALLVEATVATPQLSGARAEVSLQEALAIIAGACFPGLTWRRDPVAEFRSPRRIGLWRVLIGLAILGGGAATFGASGVHGWTWGGPRNFLFVALLTLLLVRAVGMLTAATAMAAYVGACLFVAAPADGRVHWWAVLVQPARELSPGIVTLAVLAALATAAVMHRSRPDRGTRDPIP